MATSATMKAAIAAKGTALKDDEQKLNKGNTLVRAVGGGLYMLGYSAEYMALRVWRVVRNIAVFVGQLLGMLLGGAARRIAAFFAGMWHDMTAPFRRFAKRRSQLQCVRRRARQRLANAKEKEVKTFFGVGAKSALQLAGNVLGILMPIAAAAALVFTVYNVMGMQYGLAVEVNGQVLGYVTDQTVVENAKGLLRDRIKLADNQALADWQLSPSYTIATTARFTTTHQLANEILLNTSEDPSDLVQATGLYIDGQLYAVTTEGERLREYLDEMLAPYEDPEQPEAVVGFARQVECQPNENDIFFASSVQAYDELVQQLGETVSEEVRVVADGEETLADIAQAHSVAAEALLARNPELAEEGEEFVPDAGTEVLVRRAQPFLQVQVSFRMPSTEAIPYETVENETDERPRGATVVVQDGVEGQQEVWYDYVYIDGELEGKILVEGMTRVISEPVEKIVEVGTQEAQALGDFTMPEGGYGGSYMFPVPGSPYSSRGMSGYHRGLDINAPTGTPIYACEGGVVTIAEWHWSYGWYIVIAHPGGVNTLYAHCSALFVSAGQQVGQGTHIGAVGSTGNSSGPHCHLEVTVNGGLVDPVGFVGYPYG